VYGTTNCSVVKKGEVLSRHIGKERKKPFGEGKEVTPKSPPGKHSSGRDREDLDDSTPDNSLFQRGRRLSPRKGTREGKITGGRRKDSVVRETF